MKRIHETQSDETEFWLNDSVSQIRRELEEQAARYPLDNEDTFRLINEFECGQKGMKRLKSNMSAIPFRIKNKKPLLAICSSFLLLFATTSSIMAKVASQNMSSRFASNNGVEYTVITEKINQIMTNC